LLRFVCALSTHRLLHPIVVSGKSLLLNGSAFPVHLFFAACVTRINHRHRRRRHADAVYLALIASSYRPAYILIFPRLLLCTLDSLSEVVLYILNSPVLQTAPQ